MDFLVFQLQAVMSSWGEPAVGEFRGTADHPSQSALVGLLGAALGLLREDEAAHATLRDDYGYAVGLLDGGRLLRDYHTAQVPPAVKMKGRPHATRQHELSIPRHELSTILSTRDYRQGGASLVAMAVRHGASPRYSLHELANALRKPVFTLYLGRKSCPPSAPLWPQQLSADSAWAALGLYEGRHEQARQAAAGPHRSSPLEPLPAVERFYFDDHIPAGLDTLMTVPRKDRLIRRGGWQFGDRFEHIAVLPSERA